MPRPDLADLFAAHLHRLPAAPDSHERPGDEMRMFEFEQFGQSEDTKTRMQSRVQEIGKRLVHLAEAHQYTISHPSDPVEEIPTGKRIASLQCAVCRQTIAQLSIDDTNTVTLHPTALQALSQTDHHCA